MRATKQLQVPDSVTLVDLLQWRAEHQGAQSFAAFLRDGDAESMPTTFGDLDGRARAYAAHLRHLNAARRPVLLLLPPGPDFIAAFMGCLYAGSPAVPCIPVSGNVRRAAERMLGIAANSGACVAIAAGAWLPDFRAIFDERAAALDLQWLVAEDVALDAGRNGEVVPVRPDDVAFLQYTSGSTGVPKGVVVTHANLIANCSQIERAFSVTSETRLVSWLPPHHDMGLIGGILVPLHAGISGVFMTAQAFIQKPFRWLKAISDFGATVSGGPNFAYEHCLRRIPAEQIATLDLSSWQVAFVGSEPVRERTLRRFQRAFAPCGFRGDAFFPCYGLAEATLFVTGGPAKTPPTTFSVNRFELTRDRLVGEADPARAAAIVGCGEAGLDIDVAIVDPTTRERLALGQVGEIWVRGPNVAGGYWRDGGAHSETFRAILSDGSGPFLRTGDLGSVVDGQLLVTGRRKDVIIVRGRNYYAADIEAAALNCDSALIPGGGGAFSIEVNGEERVVLVQEVHGAKPDQLPGIITSVRRSVADGMDVALHTVVLLPLGRLPRTTSGKVQRFECRARFIADSFEPLARWSEVDDAEPNDEDDTARTLLCQRLDSAPAGEAARAQIGDYVLARLRAATGEIEGLALTTPLAHLGLDSIKVVTFAQECERELSTELPLTTFYESSTVGALADALHARYLRGRASAGEGPAATRLSLVRAKGELRQRAFRLTDLQRAYWLGRNGAGEQSGVACHAYVELDCPDLDLERFRAAWRVLIRRHDMLRAIVQEDGTQRVLTSVPELAIDVHDLQSLAGDDVESALLSLRSLLSQRVVPDGAWPLFDVAVGLCPNGHARVLLGVDLLIADLQSLGVLSSELAALYEDPTASFKPLDVSFQEYVLTEAQLAETSKLERDRAYWMERLPSLPLGPDLPMLKGAEPAQGTPVFHRRSAGLSRDRWQRIKLHAQRAGLTPSAVLMAAYAGTLSAWADRGPFLLNVTVSNRLPIHPDIGRVVGDFTHISLLETPHPGPRESFACYARTLQDQLRHDLDHQLFNGVNVLRELARLRGTDGSALAPVVFTSSLGNEAGSVEEALERMGKVVYGISQTPQVWLDHQVSESKGSLRFNWDSVDALFPEGLLDDMFDCYRRSLRHLSDEEAWEAAPARPQLPERQGRAREQMNAPAGPPPADLLQAGFFRQAQRDPQRPALVSSRRTCSYGELAHQARSLGDLLRNLGVGRNQLVGVFMEKGWEQVEAVLGVLQAGAAYVPLDPDLPKERLRCLIEDTECSVVLTQSWVGHRLPAQLSSTVLALDTLVMTDGRDRRQPDTGANPDDLAYVIYTSGSTGTPKGVMVDHRAAVNTIADINARFDVGSTDKVLALSSLSFDLSVYDIFGTLAAGGAIVLPDPDKLRDPTHWIEGMRRHGVTVWNSVPALMQLLVDAANEDGVSELAGLRLVMLSGDWIPVALPDRIRRLAASSAVVGLGGATEAAIWSIFYPIGEVDPRWASIPYGRPLANQTFHVLDEALQDCPDYCTGELYIGGAGLAKGYWRDPERTAQKFVQHPLTGERLYRTGDLGRMRPDGQIEFQGRNDFQVKIHGYRVELGEIEAALNRNPAVRACVVTAVGDPKGSKRLVAYVVLADTATPNLSELTNSLRGQLPGYMVPSQILALERLPLSTNGKVDIATLIRTTDAATVEESDEPGEGTATDEVQRKILTIWRDILERPLDPIRVGDSFFELGGDSLKVIYLLRAIQREFGQAVAIRSFFSNPTIKNLAALLSGASVSERHTSLVPLRQRGTRAPLFCVPAADGSVLIFKKVVELLDQEQPVHAFQFVGGSAETSLSIAEAARQNIEELRKVQPKGPYQLAGYCWGCTVAMEMSRQLTAGGEEVEHVLLVDPLHPDYYGYFLENPVLLVGLLAQVMNPAQPVDLMPIETLEALTLDEQVSAAYEHLRRANLVIPELTIDAFRAMFGYFRNNLRALVNHETAPCASRVTLFVVEDYPPDWVQYWEGVAPLLRLEHLLGTHYSIWVDPLLSRAFARRLGAALGHDTPAAAIIDVESSSTLVNPGGL